MPVRRAELILVLAYMLLVVIALILLILTKHEHTLYFSSAFCRSKQKYGFSNEQNNMTWSHYACQVGYVKFNFDMISVPCGLPVSLILRPVWNDDIKCNFVIK